MDLSDLTLPDNTEAVRDTVGGGGFLVDSGVYHCTVKMAYLDTADSEAMSLNVELETDTGATIKEAFWIRSGAAKGKKTTYTDKKDPSKEHPLPGFTLANDLCLLAAKKPISALSTEKKVIKLYDFAAGGEVPKEKSVITDLIGTEILAGVIKQTVDKTSKNEVTGKYEPTGETRDENEIDKFFRARDSKVVNEIIAKAEEAEFINTWKNKWEGQVRNKASSSSNAVPGIPGSNAASPSAAPAQETGSVFD